MNFWGTATTGTKSKLPTCGVMEHGLMPRSARRCIRCFPCPLWGLRLSRVRTRQPLRLARLRSWSGIFPSHNGGDYINSTLIQAASGPGGPWADVTVQLGPSTDYADLGSDENGPAFGWDKFLHYRVAAINGVGTGPFSESATAGDSLILRYDANRNGVMEKSEVIRAINDYLFGASGGAPAISKAEVIRLINLYLFGE